MWSPCEQPSLPIPFHPNHQWWFGNHLPHLPAAPTPFLGSEPSPCLTFPCLQQEKGLILPHHALGKETISQSWRSTALSSSPWDHGILLFQALFHCPTVALPFIPFQD